MQIIAFIMKRHFLILFSTIFALAAISLVIIQISQTQRSAKMSDNLFNISVNNAIDEVFNQLDQMKVEDYVSEKERYRLLRYRRIDDMNERMQDIVRNNSELFYNEHKVHFGVSSQDSAYPIPGAHLTPAEDHTLTQYNTMINARNRMLAAIGPYSSGKANPFDINNVIDASKFNFPLLDSLIREAPTPTTSATPPLNTPSTPTASSPTATSMSSSPSPPPPSSSAATPTSIPSSASA